MAILTSTPEFLPREVTIAEELIDAYLTDQAASGYNIMVAEADGEVAGYICYGETPLTRGTWDIYWIAVDRNSQGRGIGRALMGETERRIKAAGGRLIVIETSSKPNYNKTRQFYAGLNYREAAIIPDFYDVGDGQVILTKYL
jgi:ribosomal protein S18 acetylase RimI-like enzyme